MNYSVSQKWNINRIESFVDGKENEVAQLRKAGLDEVTIAAVVAWYIMVIARDVYGKPNGWSYKKRRDFMEKLNWENDIKSVRCNALHGKRQYILAKAYKDKLWFLQNLVVKLWKLKCRLSKSYF